MTGTTVSLLGESPSFVTGLRRVAFVLALIAVAISFAGRRLGWLDYKPGGAAFEGQIWPALTAVFVVSLLLSIRWEIAGGVLAIFAGSTLIAFAANQLVLSHAVAVTVAFGLPGVLWVLIDLYDLPRNQALVGIGFAAAAVVGGQFVGERVYEHYWGPQHPESEIAALPDSAVEWLWSGSVTATTGEVRAKPRTDFAQARLALSRTADLSDPEWVRPRDAAGRVIGFDLDDLTPDSQYFYAIELDGQLDRVRTGEFSTFPDGSSSFSIAVGACARVGSNGQVFDTIRELDPLLYLIIGDLHYGDNDRNDLVRYQQVMDLTLALPAQSALYRSVPVAYMWDDHDYGGNDADGSSRSRQAAMAAYREFVPSYGLSGDESAVYQAFSIGRVRFVLTDARSARNLDQDEASGLNSMLGLEQKAWLKAELSEASLSHELVVWVNPVPWVAAEEEGADHWGGFAAERRELANHIADDGIDNLMMISGDAHMVAIDDGTNTDYSDAGGAGFPLMHAAALDRPGSTKGGPYSEGAIGGSGQFATLDFDDTGDEIAVTMRALDWTGAELMSHGFSTQ